MTDGHARPEKARVWCVWCREGAHHMCTGSMFSEGAEADEACICASYDNDGEHEAGPIVGVIE